MIVKLYRKDALWTYDVYYIGTLEDCVYSQEKWYKDSKDYKKSKADIIGSIYEGSAPYTDQIQMMLHIVDELYNHQYPINISRIKYLNGSYYYYGGINDY